MGKTVYSWDLLGSVSMNQPKWKIATWCQSSWCAQVLFLTRALCVRSRFEHSNPRVSFCDSASRHVQFGAHVLWVLALFFSPSAWNLKRGQWHVFRGGSLMRRQMPLQLPLKRHSPGTSQVLGHVGAGVGPAAGDWPRLRKWQEADRKEKRWDARHFIYNPSMHCLIFCVWDRLLAAWPWAEKLWAHAEQAGMHDWQETEKSQLLQYDYEALIKAAKKIYLSIYLSVYLSVYQSIYLSIYLSFVLSFYLSTYMFFNADRHKLYIYICSLSFAALQDIQKEMEENGKVQRCFDLLLWLDLSGAQKQIVFKPACCY